MRWTALLVPLVAASCATNDELAGRVGTIAPDVSADEAPEGARIEHVEELDVEFAVPADWLTVPDLDASTILDGADAAGVSDELADAGVDLEDAAAMAADNTALTVVSPETDRGVRANLTVLTLPIPGGLPGRSMLEAGLDAGGAEVLSSSTGEHDGLPIVQIRYRIADVGTSSGDALDVEGVSTFTEVDDRTIGLIVTSSDRAEADRIGDLVGATLQATG